MSFSKYLFSEKSGTLLSFVVGGVAYSMYYVPNTFFINKYVRYHQKFRSDDGKPVKPSEELQKRFEEVLDDMNFKNIMKKTTKLFITNSFDSMHMGSSKSAYGMRVGVPEHFMYKTKNDVENSSILLDDEEVDWESKYGRLLADSLILSPKAQLYVFAKELSMCDNYSFTFFAILPTVLCILWSMSCHKLNKLMKLSQKPVAAAIYVYTVVAVVFYILYSVLRNTISMLYERSAENKVTHLGKNYLVGGIEYYTKVLNRNIAFRNLLKNGSKYYTPTGNEVYLISPKSFSFTHRKLYLQGLLKNEYSEEFKPEEANIVT